MSTPEQIVRSETPLTDAALWKSGVKDFIAADFARDLERQLRARAPVIAQAVDALEKAQASHKLGHETQMKCRLNYSGHFTDVDAFCYQALTALRSLSNFHPHHSMKSTPTPKIPPGWRRLRVGTRLKIGDRLQCSIFWQMPWGAWTTTCAGGEILTKRRNASAAYIRRTKPTQRTAGKGRSKR